MGSQVFASPSPPAGAREAKEAAPVCRANNLPQKDRERAGVRGLGQYRPPALTLTLSQREGTEYLPPASGWRGGSRLSVMRVLDSAVVRGCGVAERPELRNPSEECTGGIEVASTLSEPHQSVVRQSRRVGRSEAMAPFVETGDDKGHEERR
jgi:hypothetical protein